MYKPNSLEQERSSWRTVIYFNVVHSLKHILTTLETWEDMFDEDPRAQPTGYYSPAPSSSNSHGLPPLPNGRSASRPESPAFAGRSNHIAAMRRRLTPLLATDSQLAHRLSGGVTISGGKSGVLVRSGWQARATEKVGKHFHKSASETDFRRGREPDFEDDGEILLEEVGRMLSLLKEDIRELWGHPTVKGLIMKRKLKLDEWSELLVLFVPPVRSP